MTSSLCRPDLWPWLGFAIVAVAAALSCVLVFAVRPLLQRYALAQPNDRSAHLVATPQGGGVAVTLTIFTVSTLVAGFFCQPSANHSFITTMTATLFIAALGMADDVRAISAMTRLLVQAVAVGVVVAALPPDLDVMHFVPFALERALLFVGGLWFVNLVNFMDGIDWMTVAAVMPMSAGLVTIGWLGALPAIAIVVALALFGALLGFAPFNRPVAKLFLGDAGSLPIGLLLAWLFALVASNGYFEAAILLPLYYCADATLTLFRRIRNGEQIWAAHRTHFYQRALANGFTVTEVVSRVFWTNLALAALATISVIGKNTPLDLAALAAGAALVARLLIQFSQGKR